MPTRTRTINNTTTAGGGSQRKKRRQYSQYEYETKTTGREQRKTEAVKTGGRILVKQKAAQYAQETQRTGTTEQNKRERFRTGEAEERIRAREAAIEHRIRQGVGIRRTERLQRSLIEEPVVRTVQPAANSVILVTIMFFLLIILYTLVTHANLLSGALAGFSNVIATIMSPSNLFVKTTKTS